MVGAHERRILHTALFLQLSNGWRIKAEQHRSYRFPPAVPEGEGDPDKKDHESQCYHAPFFIFHLFYFPT